jgi:selenocysteine-specific translation elongation factor
MKTLEEVNRAIAEIEKKLSIYKDITFFEPFSNTLQYIGDLERRLLELYRLRAELNP